MVSLSCFMIPCKAKPWTRNSDLWLNCWCSLVMGTYTAVHTCNFNWSHKTAVRRLEAENLNCKC